MAGEEVSSGSAPSAFIAPKSAPSREADDLPSVAIFRIGLGLAQGLGLYLLYRASDDHSWPATQPELFAPLLMIALLIPIGVSQAAGRMSRGTLVIWAVAATALVAALAWYDRYRAALVLDPAVDHDTIAPSFAVLFFTTAGLFITQSLIAAGDADSSFLTRYRNYFDATWKFGVQLVLAAAFVGVFWGALELGAALFNLIKLDFLERLLDHAWFAIPATALAAAIAIHLTDVRARLVAGIRTVGLTLLSWLLPLMALIVAGFVASLPVTGLEPLWETRSASGLLLAVSAALVVLINAAYQDGEAEGARPIVLRYAEIVGSVLLVPLVALAAYALALRVQQYGWTVDRIATLASILVASCYALGYTAAALFSLLGAQWMWALESVNIFVAFLILVLVLALFTPMADPARLSVLSQISRLESGEITPQKFDFDYLRKDGGRYGELALKDLATRKSGPHAAQIARGATLALNNATATKTVSAADVEANITVYPHGRALPPSFLKQDWSRGSSIGVPPCLTGDFKCDAYFVDMDGDGVDEILVVYGNDEGWWGGVIKQGKDGVWHPIGTLNPPNCRGTLDALHGGRFSIAAPLPRFRDLMVGPYRLSVLPVTGQDQPKCAD
jgi:hypothetical protein